MPLGTRKNRLWEKALCLFLAAALLPLTCSCAQAPARSEARDALKAGDPPGQETRDSGTTPWWKKPEYEWLIVTLIVIGVGIAAGGAIMISSGAGGLSVNVQK
jgi:hypothetical protein